MAEGELGRGGKESGRGKIGKGAGEGEEQISAMVTSRKAVVMIAAGGVPHFGAAVPL